MEIILREYQKTDFKALEEIIRKTWHYDAFASSKTAAKLARVFLSSCLTNFTFSRVAVDHGRPVGIILGNHFAKHRCPLARKWKQLTSILSLYLSKEGRKVSKVFLNVHGIDNELLKECGKTYPAELALFAVDPECRGKGIGKRLYQALLDYMKGQKTDEFYLFTDTSCNYGFYEHQGMTRRCEKEHIFNMKGQVAKMTFFLYDCQCSRISEEPALLPSERS